MLQVARLAPNLLQEAADRVSEYIGTQFNEDGGAKDRAGKSDLYYSVFALDGLIALRREPPLDRVRPWLESFGDGEGLDFIHQTCLARCWAAAGKAPAPTAEKLAGRIRNDSVGSMYHDFLRIGALEDLGGGPAPGAEILRHQSKDGSFGGTTPTTAAGVALLQHLGQDVPGNALDWLLSRARPTGGFVAVPDAPMPDLLSTATALHALSAAKRSIGALREPMLDFVDTLWTGKGFCGTWADETVDVEYTFYGLLALGHLSLA
jgi:hypothetical protein